MHYIFLLFLIFSPQIFSETESWWKDHLRNGINPWIEPEKMTQYASIKDLPQCACVKPFECSEPGFTYIDGSIIEPFRSGPECKNGLVCCMSPDSTSEEDQEITIPKPGDVINLGNIEYHPPEVDGFSQEVTQSTKELNYCGDRAYEPEIFDKIIGSDDETKTMLGDFPWMLLLSYENERIGGASLIHPQVAITSAHKVDGKDRRKIIVRGAEFDLGKDDESYSQDVGVKKVISHPGFQRSPRKKNYIAILILERPFKISSTLRAICLPPKNWRPDWDECYATGWGSTGKASTSQTLRKARMSVVPRNICSNLLFQNGLHRSYELDESFTCAVSNTTADTCQGDGGGPLQCRPNGSPYFCLVGITAWGLSCGQVGVPGIYTDVSFFIDFIEKSLAKEKIYVNSKQKI